MRKKTDVKVYTAFARPEEKKRRPINLKRRMKRRTLGERVLRDTAVAASIFLVALALANVGAPWSERLAGGIRQAVNMNLDGGAGTLQFVNKLMPEDALVFWNMGAMAAVPVEGEVYHEFSDSQPWLEYACADGSTVRCALPGTVAAAGKSETGDWTVLVNHEGGAQSVYAYLASASVQPGDELESGQALGVSGDRLYFETRVNGLPTDPAGVVAG